MGFVTLKKSPRKEYKPAPLRIPFLALMFLYQISSTNNCSSETKYSIQRSARRNIQSVPTFKKYRENKLEEYANLCSKLMVLIQCREKYKSTISSTQIIGGNFLRVLASYKVTEPIWHKDCYSLYTA